MNVRKTPIGIELVKRGIVTEEDINEALEYQKQHPSRKMGDILNILKKADPQVLIKEIGDILGEKGIVLSSDNLKVKLTDYFSLDVARNTKAIPFDVSAGKIKVCFANTVDNKRMNDVRLLLLNKGLVMERYITFETDIERILKALDGSVMSSFNVDDGNDTIISLVDSIIKTAIQRRASDIHIEPMADQVRVRYRIDGELFTAAKISKEKQNQVIGRLKAISNMHQEKQDSQDRKNYFI